MHEDDLAGSEAPAAWLTYLRGGPSTRLRRGAAHNAQDLKGLAGALLRLSALGADSSGMAIKHRRSRGRHSRGFQNRRTSGRSLRHEDDGSPRSRG
ncbi:hypothetical protein ACO2Q2_15235 [Dyella sp. KRB-257]|uniref:hypothetical protein n=1 Tax=Dyella sp. KRB-257 TaxID=3400915 RepID=UPI003BFD9B9C